MLSASVFLLVASTAARTSECDQPPPVILRRSAHPQPRTPRPAEARRAALEPLRAPFRETQLGSAQLHSTCVSLACPGAIIIGVGF